MINMHRVLEVGSFSIPKPNKEINEDFLLFPIHDENSNIVFAIADGVGSSCGASYASRCVTDAVREYTMKGKFDMDSAILFAKQQLDIMSEYQPQYKKSATTLTVIQVTDSEAVVGHIGDCRAYYKRGRKLVQLTKDHTRYQELLDSKEHSVRKLNKYKERLSSVITKALAHAAEPDYDIYRFNINELIDNEEAIITLMSDGAYEHWHKRARFAKSTMSSPTAFANSLKKRVQKCPTDDFTCLSVKIQF